MKHAVRIVECHGDSTTWGATLLHFDRAGNRAHFDQVAVPPVRICEIELRNRFGEVFCFNLGINQASSADLLGAGESWAARMRASPADVVTLNFAINDALRSASAAAYCARMCRLVAGVLAAGKAVVVETPNPVAVGREPYGDAALAQRLDAMVDALRHALASMPVTVCDHHAQIAKIDGWRELLPDGLHPGSALYDIKGRALAHAITPLIGRLPTAARP